MALNGPAFYDDDDIFRTYQARRHHPDNPNDTLELPVFLELTGELAGRRILVLGCGEDEVYGGHLEPGSEVLYLAEITILVFNDLPLERQVDAQRKVKLLRWKKE